MYKWLIVLALGALASTASAFAQSNQCPPTCKSKQCATQCLAGSCSIYCVRIVRPAVASRSQSGDFTLHIPNASPALAAKIQSLIEDRSSR